MTKRGAFAASFGVLQRLQPSLNHPWPLLLPSAGNPKAACCFPSSLKRDGIRLNRYRALDWCLRMIFPENRFALFPIMR
jgi:hypothetical protein